MGSFPLFSSLVENKLEFTRDEALKIVRIRSGRRCAISNSRLLAVLISLHRRYGTQCDPIDESVRSLHRVTIVDATEKHHSFGFSIARASKPQWPRAETTIKLLEEFNPDVRYDR